MDIVGMHLTTIYKERFLKQNNDMDEMFRWK